MISFSEFDIQGHRGARGLAPENTLPAFFRALELGVHTLEMDVVISGDEQVVVSHDPWFSRAICLLPDGRRIPFSRARSHRIFDLTYDRIACFDVGSLPHPDFPEQSLQAASKPLLRDVIRKSDAFAEDLGRSLPHYSIETKSRPSWEGRYHPPPETFVRLLIAVLREEGVTGRAIIQSFDGRTLRAARREADPLRLSLLLRRRVARHVEANIRRLGFTPHIYSPDHRAVNAAMVRRCHEKRMKVIPWTVNNSSRMLALRDMGCDGLITDYPDRAAAAFADK